MYIMYIRCLISTTFQRHGRGGKREVSIVLIECTRIDALIQTVTKTVVAKVLRNVFCFEVLEHVTLQKITFIHFQRWI